MRRLAPLALAGLAACSPRPLAADPAAARDALMAADRAFAAATAARGLEGWMDAYAADAVRLRLGGTAAAGSVVQGLEAVRAYDAALFEDPTLRLVWAPTAAGTFADGRHGFTTGRSALVRPAGADTVWTGAYVTIWRLEPDGRWRVVLDTGAGDAAE